MRVDKRFLVTTTVVAIAAGLLGWQSSGSGTANAGDVSARTAARPPAAPAQGAKTRLTRAAPSDEVSLTQQVDGLMVTHDPAKAYLAYRLLADCAEFNKEHDRLTFDQAVLKKPKPGYLPGFRGLTEREKLDETKLCNGMTERERQIRLDYLAIAAKAGVTAAAVAFAQEGPFGDPTALTTRPSDPLVREWKALAIAQLTSAAEAGGELLAMNYLIGQYGSGSDIAEKNLPLTYRYELAMGLIYRDLVGPGIGLPKLFAEDSEMMIAAAKELSPEERAAQVDAARRIAGIASDKRKRARAKPSQ
jgi:hypothetical protein